MGKYRVFTGIALLVVGSDVWNHYVHHPTVTGKMLWTAFAVWYAICYVNIVDGRYRRPVLFFGKFWKTLGGISLLDPLLFTALKDICVQEDTEEVKVEARTQDDVSVTLSFLLTSQVDPERVEQAVMSVYDVFASRLAQARAIVVEAASIVDLEYLLTNRDQFCDSVRQELSEQVARWGVIVHGFKPNGFKINDPAIAAAVAVRARARVEINLAATLNEAGKHYTADGRFMRFVGAIDSIGTKGEGNFVPVPLPLKLETIMGPASVAKQPKAETPAPPPPTPPPSPPPAEKTNLFDAPRRLVPVAPPQKQNGRPHPEVSASDLRFAPPELSESPPTSVANNGHSNGEPAEEEAAPPVSEPLWKKMQARSREPIQELPPRSLLLERLNVR